MDEFTILRVFLVASVFVLLATTLLIWFCKGYYEERMQLLLNVKLLEEERARSKEERDSKKRKKSKKKSSSEDESQASCEDGDQARTSKSARKRLPRLDLNASDIDSQSNNVLKNVGNPRSGILKQSASHVANKSSAATTHSSTPTAKASGSDIKSTLPCDDQTPAPPKALLFDNSMSFDASASSIANQTSELANQQSRTANASNTLTAESSNKYNPSESKRMASVFPKRLINQPAVQSNNLNQFASQAQAQNLN